MVQLADQDVFPIIGTGNVVKDRPYLPPSMGGTGWADAPPPFSYQAHGLTILSDLECPELAPLDAPAIVHAPLTIRLGAIPEGFRSQRTGLSGCVIKPRRLHMWIEGVGGFLALAGTTVIVEPAAGSDPAEVRLYLLGAIIGTILHQRGVMVLHASAVQTPAGAVAFVAESGVGKSTLAMAMHLAGYPLLTDDLCTVRHDPQRGIWVTPGPHRVKLAPDALAQLGMDERAGQPLSRDRDKISFMLAVKRPPWLPLVAVYVLEVRSIHRPEVVQLGIREAYQALMLNTYRRHWVGALGLQAQLFQHVVAIVGRLPIYRLSRPAAGLDTDTLVQSIEEVLKQ